MAIQKISLGVVANNGEGDPLREGGGKINQNFTDPSNAASYEVGTETGKIPRNDDLPTFGTAAQANTGTGATDVPTNANLSASIAGAATFSGDVYTFSPAGTGFRPLQEGMYLSFRLPSGSSNTTATPDINYNGAAYVVKWIDGSALVADDLDETYNKQPILFYFDGTDMLIASDISGSNANGEWDRMANGVALASFQTSDSTGISVGSFGGFRSDVFNWAYPIVFLTPPSVNGSSEEAFSVTASAVSSTTADYYYRSVSSRSTTSRDVSLTATGRWY